MNEEPPAHDRRLGPPELGKVGPKNGRNAPFNAPPTHHLILYELKRYFHHLVERPFELLDLHFPPRSGEPVRDVLHCREAREGDEGG